MGECSPSICAATEPQATYDVSAYAFEFGEDLHEPIADHKDILTSRAPECESSLQQCMQTLKQTGRLFKDPQMSTKPIILRSLNGQGELRCTFERPKIFLNDPSDPTKGKSRMYKIVEPGDSFPSQIIIRDEVMQPFGALLCFLAEHPQLIQNLILTDSNSYGIAVVRMNLGGKKEFIYIDDYMLCVGKLPLFSQPVKGIYMWPCLLEKAWLKVNGHIEQRIQKHSPAEIIRSFLSYPLTNYYFREDKAEHNLRLVRQVLHNPVQGKGYIITSKMAPPHKIGLSGRKYFYLLKVVDFEEKKLYYLRNPCTAFDFRGVYRIIPEGLQALLKRETHEVRIHEGNFVLEESEFLEQIESVTVVEFNKQAQEITQENISLAVNEQTYVMMELKGDSPVSISFNQHDYNHQDMPFLPLSSLAINLADNTLVSDPSPEAARGSSTVTFFDGVYKQLKAGQYLIRLKKRQSDLKKAGRYDRADKLVVTAQSRVKFDYKQMGLFDKHFRSFLISEGKRALQRKISDPNEELTNSGVEYVDFWAGELAVLYFEKKSRTKKEVRVEVKFLGTENLECLSHRVGVDYLALQPIEDAEVMVFEKREYSKPAALGKFIMDTY